MATSAQPANQPQTPVPTETPTTSPPVPPQRIPAYNLLTAFLNKTGIVLFTEPVDTNMKRVDDGSIILVRPTIYAKYQDQ